MTAVWAVWVGTAVAAAVLLALRPAPVPAAPAPAATRRSQRVVPGSWWRSGAALLVVWLLVGGATGLAAGCVAAAVLARVGSARESPATRREREAVRRDLPSLVLLLATSLRAGAATADAARQAATALPGPGADRLAAAVDRLVLGVDPTRVWEDLAADPDLAPLGRALGRAARTGAPVAAVVERLSDDLADTARAETEQRARAVGVRAAVPLGVCLLPSFLLLGVVPLVVSLISGIRL